MPTNARQHVSVLSLSSGVRKLTTRHEYQLLKTRRHLRPRQQIGAWFVVLQPHQPPQLLQRPQHVALCLNHSFRRSITVWIMDPALKVALPHLGQPCIFVCVDNCSTQDLYRGFRQSKLIRETKLHTNRASYFRVLAAHLWKISATVSDVSPGGSCPSNSAEIELPRVSS